MDNVIMKEKDRQPKISGGKAFAFILGVIIVINMVVMFINRLEPKTAGMASIALILGMMWLTYRVMNRRVTEYNYILTDKKIVFERVIGRSVRPILEISYNDVVYVEPEGDREKPAKTYYLLCNRKEPGRFIMGVLNKDKIYGVIYRPEAKMVKAIQQRMG